MQLYLDTADPDAIKAFLKTGLFSGVTSNPVVLQAAGLGPDTAHRYYDCCRDAGAREIFLQSFGRTPGELVEQALRYREFGPEIVIKVVSSRTGAEAAASLHAHGVPVVMTAVHSSKQTLTAMAARATYVTPYLSEMNRAGLDGLAEISAMQRILAASQSETNMVLAGVSDTATVVRYAQEGVRFVTITPDLANALLDDDLTNQMATMFNEVSGV